MSEDCLDPRDCTLLHARRLAQRLARTYDAALAPVGLTAAQFALLMHVVRQGPILLTTLADRTGISRRGLRQHLKPLTAGGFISLGHDASGARVAITTVAGRDKQEAAMMHWREAEQSVRHLLGGDHAGLLTELLKQGECLAAA